MTPKQRGSVANVRGKGTDAVERRGKGDKAIARDAAVGGQHANHAAKACRLANGAARIGSQRSHGQVGCHGRRRAAARAAGNPLRIDGIAHGPVSGVLVRRAHGKFVAIRLAQQHSAGRLQPGDGRAVVRGAVALKDFGAGRGRRALRDKHVFNAHRNARKRRQRVTLGGHGINARGLLERAFFGEGQEDV